MKRAFLTLSQIGTLLLTSFGGFYTRIAPPQDDLSFWPGVASVAAALVLIAIATIKDRIPVTILRISVIVAIICPLFYYVRYQTLTVPYGERRVICGTIYTPKGADYVSKNPAETREQIVKDFAGQTAEIWTESSINRARMALGLSYCAAISFLAFAVLSWLQRAKPPKTLN